ncbi:hypothetical protein ACWT_2925 [Actinoplanes sp. SE50]|uniref:phospholipase n=1 Tax=unclassified Actinoplanes TaxID=2626549 RepID=UPI00023EC098|nr:MULTISPECIES: phospholipase [unclassified Actinoplanes]AEV83516.1 hypothetical protein ACPL_2621 [Actinoplanes sp. SE50/110]ATO82340.1 hypothetical protein ACWT_2925 [Actinoplanes sp. SE50]SLL99747.1 hypothetical protein ACSP50_2978 [Actinoplanes sp. SE50/110]
MSPTLTALITAAVATMGMTVPDREAVLASYTQPDASSFAAWNTARQAPDEYHFDWGTDYCSASPDRPLGFDFRLPCWRHDFGYRNYKKAGELSANKNRLDAAFHADLRRTCATYRRPVRPACYTLAWVYYQGAAIFGSLTRIDPAKVVGEPADDSRRSLA